MSIRVYWQTVLKWASENKAKLGLASSPVILLFTYLLLQDAIIIHGFTGDTVCAGTVENPCVAFINITAKKDVFVYPTDYDPWGRDTPFYFNDSVSGWRLYRSWGSGWREIKLNETCKGTWCGGKYGVSDNKYSYAFRDGRSYELKLEVYKKNPSDDIKWGFIVERNEIDPVFKSINTNNLFVKLLENKVGFTKGYAIFEFLNPFKKVIPSNKLIIEFIKVNGKIYDYDLFINKSEIYDVRIVNSSVDYVVYKNLNGSWKNITKTNYTYKTITRTREVWEEIIIIPSGFHKIKIIGYRKPFFGLFNVDWVPIVNLPKFLTGASEKIVLRQSVWAWWNNSYEEKFEIVNSSFRGVSLITNLTHVYGSVKGASGETAYLYNDTSTANTYAISNNTDEFCYFDTWNDKSSCPNPNLDLISYWTLDEYSGSVKDYVGEVNGTNGGATAGEVGQVNNSYNFTGVSQVIAITNDTSLAIENLNNDFTVCLWARPEQIGSLMSAIGKGGSGFANAFEIDIDAGGAWEFQNTQNQSGSVTSYVNGSTTYGNPANNNYYHVCVVMENANVVHSGAQWSIGGLINTRYWSGSIDDVRIYNKSLSAAEVEYLYNSTNDIYITNKKTPVFYDSTINSVDGKISQNSYTSDTTPDIEVNFTSDFSTASAEIFVNSTPYGWNFTVVNNTLTNITVNASLSEGYYEAYVVFNTSLDNDTSSNFSFNIDTTNPSIVLDNPSNHSYQNSAFYVNLSISDSGGLDTVLWSNDTWVTNYTSFEGSYDILVNASDWTEQEVLISVWANDTAGNVNITQINVTIDLTAPTINITSPANTTYSTQNINLNFTIVESLSPIDTCQYMLNGGSNNTVASCVNGTSVSGFDDGSNYVELYINDSAGNLAYDIEYFTNNLVVDINDSLTTNYFRFTWNASASVTNDTQPDNQTSSVPIINITNNGTGQTLDIQVKLLSDTNLGWTVWVTNSSDGNQTDYVLDEIWQTIYDDLANNDYNGLWFWANATMVNGAWYTFNDSFNVRAAVN